VVEQMNTTSVDQDGLTKVEFRLWKYTSGDYMYENGELVDAMLDYVLDPVDEKDQLKAIQGNRWQKYVIGPWTGGDEVGHQVDQRGAWMLVKPKDECSTA